MPTPQTYKNHARYEPMFHFFVAPVLLINVIVATVILIHRGSYHIWLHAWLLIMAIALLLLVGIARSYATRVQDRVIRLEENRRYQHLLPPELLAATQSLRVPQIVALRFASDAELPALVQRTLNENLNSKVIKQSITNWRADNLRV
jgi:ABC-type cobalamin transport system permease subunit